MWLARMGRLTLSRRTASLIVTWRRMTSDVLRQLVGRRNSALVEAVQSGRSSRPARAAFRAQRRRDLDAARRRGHGLGPLLRGGARPGVARIAPRTPRARSTEGLDRATDREGHRHPPGRPAPPQTLWSCRQEPLAVVVRARRGGPRTVLPCLPAALRHRACLPLREGDPRPDDAPALHTHPGRPLDLACCRRVHRAPTGPRRRRRPPPPLTLGTTVRPGLPQPMPCAARMSATASSPRHTCPAAEVPDARPRTHQRHPKTPENSLSGGQEGGLSEVTGLIEGSEDCSQPRLPRQDQPVTPQGWLYPARRLGNGRGH